VLLASGDRAILRMPPRGPLPPGANDMAREHRILANLWKALPLAPRSFLHCDDTSVAGTQFHLLEFREGLAVRGDSVAPLPPTAATGARLSGIAIEVLARIHRVDPAAVGLQDLGRPSGFLTRTAKGWINRAVLVCGGEMGGDIAGDLRKLADWLSEDRLDGIGGDGTLLHNDFKLDNVLLDAKTLDAAAVLDWDMCTRGDALMDLATLLSYWTERGDPDCMHRLAQMPTAGAGFMSREEAANAYARATGRSLDHFHVYRVLAMFRLSVVFLQLHSRWRSGEVADARYAGFGELAHEIAGFTASIAEGRIF
jgi:aminoglycoside phosphotransferase (APT) family kinase protein